MKSTIPLTAAVYAVCLQSAALSAYAFSLVHASYLPEDNLPQAQQLHLFGITGLLRVLLPLLFLMPSKYS